MFYVLVKMFYVSKTIIVKKKETEAAVLSGVKN